MVNYYQLNNCTYVEMMEACTRIPRNGVKMETIAPRNDHATEWNINFLLTATVKKLVPTIYYAVRR